MPNVFVHDPDAALDYKFNWAEWLEDGETIATYTVTPNSANITVDDDMLSDANTSVTVWLSAATLTTHSITCHIVTSAGREDDRTMLVRVRER